ncbi:MULTISPECIES: biotin--[acetyl-CoA-carboxylase] ligase [unclassified Luteococcus]|uniref:biotin--[acetyl-CoA-carboxylase] ligase n=1 Tax=unclassified Luteococcus TaxID=2639923 RepID=UPI00313AE1FC
MPASEPVDQDLLSRLLSGVSLWKEVRCVPTTGSTNADLTELARNGTADGIVLVSEEQTAGRGRFQRRWETPAGAAVAFSLLVRPSRPAQDWGWLSLLAGMAVATGIERATEAQPGRVELKWPNDVLIDGRKVCGILSERVESDGGSAAAVVGVGINVSLDEAELPVPHATSLRLAGLSEDKAAVLAAIFTEFARLYELWERDGQVHDEYAERCASIGAALRVMVDEHTNVLGTGDSVDQWGRLVVRTADGLQAFSAGDVFHLRLQ